MKVAESSSNSEIHGSSEDERRNVDNDMQQIPMNLRCATLVPGTESPIGDGYTGALRCVIQLQDGAQLSAVIKRIPFQGVLAEAFSALLLRAWGLTVPEPFLVKESDRLISFASADATYPSLKQRFGIAQLPDGPMKNALVASACAMVSALPQAPLAMMADEAIDNRDRNLGNILWDGKEETWIDHELALGLAQHHPDANKLALMITTANNVEAIKSSAIASWMMADRLKVPEASDAVAATASDLGLAPQSIQMPDFSLLVSQRLAALGNRILSRFPTQQDLFSQP